MRQLCGVGLARDEAHPLTRAQDKHRREVYLAAMAASAPIAEAAIRTSPTRAFDPRAVGQLFENASIVRGKGKPIPVDGVDVHA